MAQDAAAIAEIEKRIAAVRGNIIELTEQAAAFSGASDDELAASRIAQQEAELARLTAILDGLLKE